MGVTLRKLFNLYPGEGQKVALFALFGFLWAVGIYGCFTLSEGLFLEQVGARALPKLYFILATGISLFSALLLFILAKFSVHRLLFFIVAAALAAFAFVFLLYTFTNARHEIWFWYLFRFLGSLFEIVVYICYWAFVDQYFHLQDAKRLFCFFNAILFLGNACGGACISFGLSTLGIHGALALFLVLIAASIPFITLILKKVPPILEEHVEGIESASDGSFKKFFKTVIHSRFTLILMSVYFVMHILAVVTQYNSLETVERVFSKTGEEHMVAAFLGSCTAWISLANMCFGLFFYSRLAKKMGINNIILIAPSCFIILFLLWFSGDYLFLAVLGLIAHDGLLYTFDDNNLNLLIAGVPSKVKNQVRVTIESFLEPLGMLVSSLLLLGLQNESKILGLFVAAFALTLKLFLRTQYARAIFRNLIEYTVLFEKRATDWLKRFSKKEKREAEYLLLSMLKRPDEPSKLLAYESLLTLGNERWLPYLLQQMHRLSIPGKIKVIDLLASSSFATNSSVVELLQRWRRTIYHPSLLGTIHFYFAKHRLIEPGNILSDLSSHNLFLRAAAILSLKTADSATQESHLPYLDSANVHLTSLLQSEEEEEIKMGIRILGLESHPKNSDILIPYLTHPAQSIVQSAALSLAHCAHPDMEEHLPTLIALLPRLNDNQARLSLLDALDKLPTLRWIRELILASLYLRPNERKRLEKILLKHHTTIAPLLLSIALDTQIPHKCRLLAGKTLGKINITLLRNHLHKALKPEIERAYFYFYHASTIQKQVPQEDLSLLENGLLSSYQSILDFIIQLLGVAGSIQDCEVLSHTLKSKNQKIRAHALETIEKTCQTRLFVLLEPLLDPRRKEEKVRHYLLSGSQPLSLDQLLEVLTNSCSTVDQLVALSLKTRLNASAELTYPEREDEIMNPFTLSHIPINLYL